MTHTQNYNLTQWDAADRILRADFNADNAALDAALAAHDAQLAKLGNCGIEVYPYTGTGTYGTEHPTVIRFSRMPAFFLLIGYHILLTGTGGAANGDALRRMSSGAAYLDDPPLTWSGTTMRFIGGDAVGAANAPRDPYFVFAVVAEDAK